MRVVEISTDHLTVDPSDSTDDMLDTLDEKRYQYLLDDQTCLLESGLTTTSLAKAFSQLPNCREIAISDAKVPWGVASMEKQIGVTLGSGISTFGSTCVVKQVIRIVMAAVIVSQTTLEKFTICFGSYSSEALGPDILALPELFSNQLRACLAGLRTLDVTLSPELDTTLRKWKKDTFNFLTLFPDVEQLRLAFLPRDELDQFRTIGKMFQVRRLRVLTIHFVDCSESDLARFILRHKNTLKEISFSNIRLRDGGGSWKSLLRMMWDKLSITSLEMTDCQLAREPIVFIQGNNTMADRIKVGGGSVAFAKVNESIRVNGINGLSIHC
jgi:hypothetical protein